MPKLFLRVILLVLLPWTAFGVDLEDLNVPAARMPTWYPFDETWYDYAQAWTEYDVTCTSGEEPCASGKNSYQDMAAIDDECDEVTTTDFSGMDCMINLADANTVLYIPAGTYELDDGEGMGASRDNIVVRGAGMASTIIERQDDGTEDSQPDCAQMGYHWQQCGTGDGASTAWTAGYTRGTSVVTVTSAVNFTDPGWIRLDMTNTTACLHVDATPNMNGDTFSHFAKITDITGTNITMDRPLRMTYNEAGCTGFTAYPWVPSVHVGLEDLTLTTDTGVAQSNFNISVMQDDTAESWIVGVKLDRADLRWISNIRQARMWWQGCTFQNLLDTGDTSVNSMHTKVSSDVVYENNICDDAPVCWELQSGPEGTVLAYNYMNQSNVVGECSRSIFFHGHYVREVLMEGNDIECALQFDSLYGRHGPRNTVYRNRNRSNDCNQTTPPPFGPKAQIGWEENAAWDSDDDDDFTQEYTNIIGNTAEYFGTRFGGSFAVECDDVTRGNVMSQANNHVFNEAYGSHSWYENNAYRADNSDESFKVAAVDAGNPRSCGGRNCSSTTTTFCDVDGDCPATETCDEDTCPGTNKETLSPDVSWSGSYPTSLYRTSAPDWWCQEACEWSQDGIGAFGDTFGTCSVDGGSCMEDADCPATETCDGEDVCQLPAEIRFDEGPCTALVTEGGSIQGATSVSGVTFN